MVGFDEYSKNAPFGIYYFSTDFETLQTKLPQLKVTCNSVEDAIDELCFTAQSLAPNTYELGRFRLTQREGSILHIWEVFQHKEKG